ncbi:MAG: radical SAM protein [Treponema sp.]|nr:radical SAM protein [Treponema sp.]
MYVSDFYKNIFGCKVYKISLDAGCTCPTRDGTKGSRGCIFCSPSGSGDFAATRGKPVSEQIEEAKKLVEKKIAGRKGETGSGGKYIAYFQNFTNTYGDPERLAALYNEAAACPDMAGISIGTRPDCLNDKILSEISKLCDRTPSGGDHSPLAGYNALAGQNAASDGRPHNALAGHSAASDGRPHNALAGYDAVSHKASFLVSIELGLQTVNEKSAEFIRRGFPLEEYFNAIRKIRKADSRIHIVTHVIFGLPGETEKDMMNTVRTVCETADGIKISCLHILKDTDLADLYEKGQVKTLGEEEYYNLIVKALEIIPKDFVIHRLTGDGAKSILIAPMWTANKRKVHNELSRRFKIF